MNEKGNEITRCFNPEDKIYGHSYGEWITKWWEWALSVPESNNPILDDTGQYAHLNQDDKVWFLAGTIGDENKVAHRTCVIPKGRSILFPIINYIYTEDRPFDEIKLIKHVQQDIDDIVVKVATIDGCRVPIYRVRSDPCLFNLRVAERNRLRIRVGTIDASADGYWVFVKFLNSGQHEIYFHGACSGGARNASAQYKITVK